MSLIRSKVLALWFAKSAAQKGMILRIPFLFFFLLVESCLLSLELDVVDCAASGVPVVEDFCTSLTWGGACGGCVLSADAPELPVAAGCVPGAG